MALDRTNMGSYWKALRVILLIGAIALSYWALNRAGFLESVNAQGIRELVARAGIWGPLVYVCIFTLGQLLQLPGMIFVVAAALAFGNSLGFVYAMVGAVVAVSVVFIVVRSVGGTPLANPSSRWVSRAVNRLESRPFKSIFLLRLAFATAPWLNYALALSPVNYRHYISASLLGIIPQVLGTILLADGIMG